MKTNLKARLSLFSQALRRKNADPTKTSTKNRETSVSLTFKAGSVCLAFLIIGFETCLFATRAMALRADASGSPAAPPAPSVAAPADNAAVPASAAGNSDAAGSSAPVPAAAKPSTAFKPRPKPETFRFNPNTVSAEDLQRLGFSEKQAASIVNYRQAGGHFARKSDFAKSYVVSDEIFKRLEGYIDIPLTDINSADSASFDALPGIGPYFASAMVRHRAELGGYSSVEQLLDIYRFDSGKLDSIRDLICCLNPPQPLQIWELPEERLAEHPYIRKRSTAHSIVIYRENNPPEALTLEGLLAAGVIDSLAFGRLKTVIP